MKTGMLWLDDGRASLDEKVRLAAAYYRQKYGRVPDLCYVNKSSLNEERQVDEIQVCPATNVLPHHLWLGMKNS